jgi:hypothetical protein
MSFQSTTNKFLLALLKQLGGENEKAGLLLLILAIFEAGR